MFKLASSLRSNRTASASVEFALLGPAFIAMFFGVMQIGIGMQNYNALRSISAETARYAVTSYQHNHLLLPVDMQDYAKNIATAPPYGLQSSRFVAFVSVPATQRVTGAGEYQITLTYRIPTWLGIIGVSEIPITYTRPIFVIT